ncbi:MAG: M9 family metallopeptidase N-terminal domain-containing protein, partial [Burkholderiales bacterium]|nr:M9 family metallopeptidase N-terminal domain-containing protein [Burkholderiales bacterium]
MFIPFQTRLICGAIALACISFATSSFAQAMAPSQLDAYHVELGAAHGIDGAIPSRMPTTPQALPPSLEQIKFNLPASSKPRTDLQLPTEANKQQRLRQALASTPACEDMAKLATYKGEALADYLLSLPSYECHYGLFSLPTAQANIVFSSANFDAVARRFVSEGAAYNASNIKLVNLLIYLRAGYYLASNKVMAAPAASITTTLRPAISGLLANPTLFQENKAGPSTANETMLLITNMNDEANYLPAVKNIVQRYTNSASNPKAVDVLKGNTAGRGFTGALTVFFYAHYRAEGKALLQSDASYPQALYNFFNGNKTALLGTSNQYQLTDSERETFRFLQYSAQKNGVKSMIKNVLATTSMTG